MPGKLFYQLHLLVYVRAISISKGKILGAHKVQGFAVWKEPYSRVNIVQPSRYPTEVLVVRVVPLYSLPGTVRRCEEEHHRQEPTEVRNNRSPEEVRK